MSKILALMILFNVLVGVAFVYSNYYIWNNLNILPYTSSSWGPFVIAYFTESSDHYSCIGNYPFWLFWVTIIGNILFAVLILRIKEAS